MTQPRPKIAIASYSHTKDIKSGAIAIAGVEPDFVEVVPIIGAFRRMVRDVEFDVCEMAPTYMIARALGAPFIALPIFLMRRFHHGGFVVRPDAGIKVPKGPGRQKGRSTRLFGHHRGVDARRFHQRIRARLREGHVGGR